MNAELLLMGGLVCCRRHVSWTRLEETIRLYGYTTGEITLLRGGCASIRRTPKAVLQVSPDLVDSAEETWPEGVSEDRRTAAVGAAEEGADQSTRPTVSSVNGESSVATAPGLGGDSGEAASVSDSR